MNFIFSPIRTDQRLEMSVQGDTLILNGEVFDFSPLGLGDTLPKDAISSEWFYSDIYKDLDGELTVHVLLPHGVNAPKETLFPKPISVTSGEVVLPLYETLLEDNYV